MRRSSGAIGDSFLNQGHPTNLANVSARETTQLMTPDDPYRPSLGNEEDERLVMKATGALSTNGIDTGEVAPSRPASSGQGRSLLPPLDEDLGRLVLLAERKLASGRTPSLREGRVLAYRGALRLLGSRRPAAVAEGTRILAKLDQQRTKEKEERRQRREERKRIKREIAGMRLPFMPR